MSIPPLALVKLGDDNMYLAGLRGVVVRDLDRILWRQRQMEYGLESTVAAGLATVAITGKRTLTRKLEMYENEFVSLES